MPLSNNAAYNLQHSSFRPPPTDAFGHGNMLLEMADGDVIKMKDIITKELKLANISDDRLVMLYQMEIHSLTSMYGIATRDARFMPVFQRWFINYLGELATTRAKNAKERDMQAILAGKYNPNQTPGYGQDIMMAKQQAEETKRSFIDKIFNRNKGGN